MRNIILSLIIIASFDSAFFQPMHIESQNMDITPIGMNSDGQFVIAQSGDTIMNTAQADWNASSGLAKILNEPILATVATSGSYNDLSNQPAIPSVARTVSSLSLSLVGTGATGTQISATKGSSVRCCISTSTTSTIGGASTSIVSLKKCATNNATEGSWTTVAILENDQTISLAIALQSLQIIKGQLAADLDPAWYVKLVNTGTGTHAETSISGEQTIYG